MIINYIVRVVMNIYIKVALISAAMLATIPFSATADPIVITDHENRIVTIPKPVERIASIPIPIASTIISIDGRTSKLVGMNPMAKSAITEGILGKIFPESKDIPSDITASNFIPNIEELAATNPDLVVQWAGYGADYVNPILNSGLNVMLISYGTEQKAREYMTMVANALGKPERIEDIVAWRDAVAADIATKTKDIATERKPKILYLGRALDTLMVSGDKDNYNAYYINLAGGISASKDVEGQSVGISPEQIAEWDPDIILLNSFEPKLDISHIYNNPIISLTKAAKNNKVYKMPLGGYRWDPPSQESPLTWMWVANLIHPEIFNYDLRSEMRKAYKTLYNYDLTNADIDSILWLDMQGDTANYARFKAQ